MLGCLPALATFPKAAALASDEAGYRKLLAKIRDSAKALPSALVSGVIRRICEDEHELLTGEDSEDYQLLVSFLELPFDFSRRITVESNQTHRRAVDASLIPSSLSALGLAILDGRISSESQVTDGIPIWKRLGELLSYGVKEAGVLAFTASELAEATAGLLFAADSSELLDDSVAEIAPWMPLFPMLLNGYDGDWAFFDYGDERHYDDVVVLRIFLALHDAAFRDGFIDLAAALLSVAVIELSVLGEQPLVLASAEFVSRARNALSEENAEAFRAALDLAKAALEQREMSFAVRWISQPALSIRKDGSNFPTAGVRALPMATLLAGTRREVDEQLGRLLPQNVREVLGEDAWDFLIDAELQWSSGHRHFATPEQTDWGSLVVAFFKAIEQPIVRRYAPVFDDPGVRSFCKEEHIDIGRSTSIGQVRAFLAKKQKYPPDVVDLLAERRLAIQESKDLVETLTGFIGLRNIAAHGTGKVTAEQFAKFRSSYFKKLPEIASGLG